MMCVTGREPDLKSLEYRLDRLLRPPWIEAAPLHEVRLDALDRFDEDLWGLLRRHAPRLIACCRPARQGGGFRGSEQDRLAALERAAVAGVAYVDVEADVPEETLRCLEARAPGRLLLSWHDLEGVPGDLSAQIEQMARRGAAVAKLAVTPGDAAQLAPLLAAGRRFQGRAVLIGMGTAGLLSRCRYRAFGSTWTYVADGEATAPGQLGLAQALEMGLPEAASAPFLALLGGGQVTASPGPAVYNRLFRRRGLPWSYIPVLSERAAECLELLRELGALGLSVTMPHKRVFLGLTQPDATAVAAKAVNSVRLDHGSLASTNTDIAGVAEPLAEALGAGRGLGKRALVLGAGAAARAAVLACESVGLQARVSARDLERARCSFGGDVPLIGWEERFEDDAPVLINATPIGGESTPWPDARPLGKAIVFDLALAAEPSALVARARREGALALGPERMWTVQGAHQMSWITQERVTPRDLEELLP